MNGKSLMPKKASLQKAAVYTALATAVVLLVCVFFVGLQGQKSIFYYFDESISNTKATDWEGYWSFLAGTETKPKDLINSCESLDITYMVATCAISAVTLGGVVAFSVLSILAFVKGMKTQAYKNCVLCAVIAAVIYCAGVAGVFAMENLATPGAGKAVMNAATIIGLVVAILALVGIGGCKAFETVLFEEVRARRIKILSSACCFATALVAFLVTAFMTVKAEVGGVTYRGTPFTFAFMTIVGWGEKSVGTSSSMEISAQFAQIFFGGMLIFLALGMVRQIRNVLNHGKYKNGVCWAMFAAVFALFVLLFSLSLATGAKKLAGDGCTVSLIFPILVLLFNVVNAVMTVLAKKKCEKEMVQHLD